MFRKITLWLSGGRGNDVKAGGGGSCGRSHLHGTEEKKRKKRSSTSQKDNVEQVSISLTFYEQLFCTKVFCAAFMCLHFGLEIFWLKELNAKAARKMLVKLTTGDKHVDKRHHWRNTRTD